MFVDFRPGPSKQDSLIAWIPYFEGNPEEEIPTTTEWGLIALLVLLLGTGVCAIMRRRAETMA
jgi:hypothetical protein